MKIIENNNTIDSVCRECKSKLAIEFSDIDYNEIPHHCSSFEYSCCACGAVNPIKSNDIPRSWVLSLVEEDF